MVKNTADQVLKLQTAPVRLRHESLSKIPEMVTIYGNRLATMRKVGGFVHTLFPGHGPWFPPAKRLMSISHIKLAKLKPIYFSWRHFHRGIHAQQ